MIRSCVCVSAGFPIAVGYPHFYKADPAVINAIEGVYPDASKHQTHFIIEPVSLTTKPCRAGAAAGRSLRCWCSSSATSAV